MNETRPETTNDKTDNQWVNGQWQIEVENETTNRTNQDGRAVNQWRRRCDGQWTDETDEDSWTDDQLTDETNDNDNGQWPLMTDRQWMTRPMNDNDHNDNNDENDQWILMKLISGRTDYC